MPLNAVAKIAITAAITGINMAVQSTRNLGDRNRLDDTAVTQGDYGAGIPRIWGTRRIEGAPIFWAEPLTEIKRRRKTKGGKYNDYSYFGSWACAVACHEIEGITRIWFDKHLVYDATGAGALTALSGNSGFVLADHIRFYLGTETQEADPYMLASVEAAQGAGSCPAYRGIAYAMFEQIPLEKFGNRIPQVTIEAVGQASVVYSTDTLTPKPPGLSRLWGFGYSVGRDRFISADSNSFAIWDLPSRSLISEGTFSPATRSLCSCIAISSSGTIYAPNAASNSILAFPADGLGAGGVLFDAVSEEGCKIVADSSGRELLCVIAYGSEKFFVYDLAAGALTEYDSGDLFGYDFRAGDFFFDEYDDLWVVGAEISATHYIHLHRIIDNGSRPGSPSSLRYASGGSNYLNPVMGLHRSGNFVLFRVDSDKAFIVDQDDFGIVTEKSIALDIYTAYNQVAQLYTGAATLWLDGSEYALPDLTLIRTVNLNSWSGGDVSGIIYDPVNHAIITAPQFASNFSFRYLDRIGGAGSNLQAICEDVAELCGVADHDFSALSSITVDGWSATGATGIDMLQPLLDIYDCDIRPHDFSVQGVVRGGASGATIDYLDFVPGEGGRYAVKIAQSAEMPRAVVLNFADKDHDQQVNSVRVSRPGAATDTESDVSIDMTDWSASADYARQALGRYFRRRWNSREVLAINLTAQQVALEPADLRTLGLESDERLGRLVRSTLTAGGVISAEFVADDPNLHLLDGAAGPGFDGRLPEVIAVPGPVRGFVADVPLAIDAHDSAVPFLYYAAGPYGSAFAGADFAISDNGVDADFVDGWANVEADGAISWGVVTTPLGDALPWVFDNGNEINVQMRYGTPPIGVTADQLLADGTMNLVLIGGEWIQYQSRVLESDGSYTLTGLLRGCRGTEHAISGHAIGETVLFVSTGLFRRELGAGEIGDTDFYRAAAVGRDVVGAYQTSVTFAAAANKPYAPVHGVALLDTGTGDWSISATRRTRIGGANVNGQDVPLGEVSESWAADIMDGATVVRTITGTSLPLAYTSAQQTTDWGAPQTSIEVNLYQVSPALSLRGFPLNIAA